MGIQRLPARPGNSAECSVVKRPRPEDGPDTPVLPYADTAHGIDEVPA